VSHIKRLSQKDFDDFVTVVVNAYPGFRIISEEDKKKFKQRYIKIQREDPTVNLYGLFRQGKLLGVMRLHDFTMNLLSTKTLVGGVGLVAVDLLHKKEKVCKELIIYFLKHYLKKGACMTALYPFRPDFYKKMGFGYGTKMNQYRIKPASLPRGNSKEHIQFIQKKDKQTVMDCYNRYFEKTHGMMKMTAFGLHTIFGSPNTKVVGCKSKNKIKGYIAFSFKRVKENNFILNDLHILECIYENRKVLSELLAFLHTQADQVNDIVFNTQDEYFHYLPLDPRNGSENMFLPAYHESNLQGVGIMYRVIDTKGIFRILKNHNFNNQNCKLKLSIHDSFLKQNDGSVIVHFVNGTPHLKKGVNHEVEIRLDVSDFSSFIMGVVPFKSLYNYRLAEISDIKYINVVSKIFMTEENPICTTLF